jgi:hypothetical protein
VKRTGKKEQPTCAYLVEEASAGAPAMDAL